MRDGQEVRDAVVAEIDEGNVKYKIGQRETIYVAKKADIMMILYNDGTKDVFNAEAKETEKPVAETKTVENKNGFAGIRVAYNTAGGGFDELSNYGFAIGGIWNYSITQHMAIRLDGNLVYRSIFPNWDIVRNAENEYRFSDYEHSAKEFAYVSNVLFNVLPFGGPIFYLECGFQLGTSLHINSGHPPAEAKDVWGNPAAEAEYIEKYTTRTMLDFGPVFGFGWNINENFALGLRGIVYYTNIYKEYEQTPSLYQAELGLSYMF